MVPAILSVLLFGMLPGGGMLPAGGIAAARDGVLSRLSIAPPVPLIRERPELARLTGITASGILVLDLRSGQAVYARGANERRPIASLTKLMTALVVAERHDLREWVTVPADVTGEGHVVRLPPGERFTVGDLLKALLVDSANDAADTLARFHAGSTEEFVAEMNVRARELGLRDTSFANPMGFDDPDQWSTARDLGWLTSYVLRRPELRSRLSLRSGVIASREGTELAIAQTHMLLHESTPVVAGKTGTTIAAGECLDSIVKLGSREYVVVILGSRDRYADMRLVLSVLASLIA